MLHKGIQSDHNEKSISGKKERSFFSMLILSFLIVSIITTVLLTSVLMGIFVKSFSSSTKDYNQQLQSQTNFAIDQLQKSVDNFSRSLLNNYNVQAYLSMTNIQTLTPVKASHEINDSLLILSYFVDNVYLYNHQLDILYNSKNGHQWEPERYNDPSLTDPLKDPDFLVNQYGKPIAVSRTPSTGSANIIRYYYMENRTMPTPNVIIIDIHANVLTDAITNMQKLSSNTASSFLLLDENETYITSVLDPQISEQTIWLKSAISQLKDSRKPNQSFVKIDGNRYFKVQTTSNVYNWKLINFIPTEVVFHNILLLTAIGLLIAIIVFIFSYFICLHFARKLNSPIETLAHTLNGSHPQKNTYILSTPPREIQTILSAVTSLQESHQQLTTMQQKTKYSAIQSYLRGLVLNINQDPPTQKLQRLDELHLTYIAQKRLCMVILKIDDYQNFLKTHDSSELWAIRFSIVNITEEIAGTYFTCNAFGLDNDKFILLISRDSLDSSANFEETLLSTLLSIQKNVNAYLHFTVSIAFSTIFHGLTQLHPVYQNIENVLLLKMRYGHNCIIDPYQPEDIPEEPFQLPYRSISQIVDELSTGDFDKVWTVYTELTDELYLYDYNEIMSSMIHLAYSIYERISEKFPMIRDSLTEGLKSFHSTLHDAEIFADIQELTKVFFQQICDDIQKIRENPAQQNNALVADRIIQIIEKDYTNPALCLNSIADTVGLSANYVGQLFKQQTQKSVSQYLLEIRMELVGNYLKTTSLPLNKILDKVGLEKNNYFYTRFKNYFGMSLNEYRQHFSPQKE